MLLLLSFTRDTLWITDLAALSRHLISQTKTVISLASPSADEEAVAICIEMLGASHQSISELRYKRFPYKRTMLAVRNKSTDTRRKYPNLYASKNWNIAAVEEWLDEILGADDARLLEPTEEDQVSLNRICKTGH